MQFQWEDIVMDCGTLGMSHFWTKSLVVNLCGLFLRSRTTSVLFIVFLRLYQLRLTADPKAHIVGLLGNWKR